MSLLSSYLPASRRLGQEAPAWILRRDPELHPSRGLFRGLTEYAFMNELGIGDPSLVGYVAELLASFVPKFHGAATARQSR